MRHEDSNFEPETKIAVYIFVDIRLGYADRLRSQVVILQPDLRQGLVSRRKFTNFAPANNSKDDT